MTYYSLFTRTVRFFYTFLQEIFKKVIFALFEQNQLLYSMKHLIHRILYFFGFLLSLISCSDDPTINVFVSSYNISATGGTQKLNVQSNVNYEVIVDNSCKDWISLLSTRAMQDSKITLEIRENVKIVERKGKVVIKYKDISQEVFITQQAAQPAISVSQNDFVAESDGETIMININSNVEYNVEISQNDWIKIGEVNSNSLNNRYFIISRNENFDERSCEIIVYNSQYNLKETIKITQKQKSAIIIDGDLSIGALGGTLIQNVRSNVDYSVKCDAEWVKLKQTRSLSNKILEFDIEKNSDREPRSTLVTLTNGILEVSFTVTQDGASSGSSDIDIIPIVKL